MQVENVQEMRSKSPISGKKCTAANSLFITIYLLVINNMEGEEWDHGSAEILLSGYYTCCKTAETM